MASRVARDLYVDDVFHRTFIAVDELGTEAVAATAAKVVLVSEVRHVYPKGVPELHADRPFLFFLRERIRNRVLFVGRVTNPS